MLPEPLDEWIERLMLQDSFAQLEEDARRRPGGVDGEARPLEGQAGSGFTVGVELSDHESGVEFSSFVDVLPKIFRSR